MLEDLNSSRKNGSVTIENFVKMIEFSGASTNDREAIVMPFLEILAQFREVVRSEARLQKNIDILKECDRLRDEILPELGVRLEDHSKDTCVKLVDRDTLMKEKEQKEAIVREKEQRKVQMQKEKEAKKKAKDQAKEEQKRKAREAQQARNNSWKLLKIECDLLFILLSKTDLQNFGPNDTRKDRFQMIPDEYYPFFDNFW